MAENIVIKATVEQKVTYTLMYKNVLAILDYLKKQNPSCAFDLKNLTTKEQELLLKNICDYKEETDEIFNREIC